MRFLTDWQTIATLDRLADAAWPAEEEEVLGPWKLRASPGMAQRASSVLPALGPPGRPVGRDERHLLRLVDLVEAFYAQRQMPAAFYLSPAAYPADLDRLLGGRGYAVHAPAQVWIGSAAQVQLSAGRPGMEVVLGEVCGDDWISCAFDDPLALGNVRRQIGAPVAGGRIFASVRNDGRVIATAMGIAHPEDWMGVFCLCTRPAFRRRGCARALLGALGAWGLAHGQRALYLQVATDNTAAIGLYRACGFEMAYAYHYRLLLRRAAKRPGAAPG